MGVRTDTSSVRAQAAALVAEADRLVQPEARSEKLTEVGDLYRDAAATSQASEYYFQAVAVFPEAPNVALSRLARLARETGDVQVTANLVAGLSHAGRWKDVVTVLTRQADSVHDTDERAGLLLEASRTCTHRLNDFGRARALLLAAARSAGEGARKEVLARLEDHVRRHPADDAVGVACARLLTTEGDARRAVAVLVQSAHHALERRRKASLLFDAAILCADRVQQPVEALVHFYEAMAYDPELTTQVQARLDAIQARWLHEPEVADTLEGIYSRLRQPERVHEVMEGRLAFAEPEARPGVLLALAEHAEYHLLEVERAFQLYRQGLEEGRGDLAPFAAGMRRVGAEGVSGAMEAMTTLFGRLGRWQDLVEVLDDEAALQPDDADRAALLFRAGEILQTHGDDLEGAMQRYVKAFQLQPHNPRYLAAGERLYRRRKDWRMVDRLLGLQVKIAKDQNQCQRLLVEQARLRHRKLSDPVGAYDAIREALGAGEMEPAMNALRELARDERGFVAIERGLRDRAAAAEPAAAAVTLLELGLLQLDVRAEPAAALSAFVEASRLRPEDLELFHQVAGMMAEHADPAVGARWLVEAASRAALPAQVRREALRQGAEIYESVNMPGPARDARRALLVLDPQDAVAFDEALTAARLAGEPGPIIRLLTEALSGQMGPVEPDEASRQAWRKELAILHSSVGDTAAAADCWQSVLADDPLDPEAVEWLHGWYRDREAWESLRGLLDIVAEAHAEADGTSPLHLIESLADLAEGAMADPRLALVYARRLLEADPQSDAARARVHRLLDALGDREGQIGLVELELVTAPPEEREALAHRLVALASVPPVAFGARRRGLEALLALAPDDVDRMDRLAQGLREEGTPEAQRLLAGVLARRWAADPSVTRVGLLRELAQVHADVGAAPAEVVRAWRAVLDIVPDDDEGLAGLQTAHARAGDDAAVLEVIQRRRELLPEHALQARRRLVRESAMVAEVRLGEPERAVALWEEVLESQPHDAEALEELVRLTEAAGQWVALLRFGRQRLDYIDGADRAALARRLAALVDGDPALCEPLDLDPVDEAARLWGVVRQAEPDAVDALEGLARAAAARGDRVAVMTALDALVPQVEGAALADLHARRAVVLAEIGDLGAAVEAWESTRSLRPDDRAPVTAIRRLSLERKDWWGAARAMAAELRFVEDVEESLALNRQLARLSGEALGDQLGEMAAWERILSARADDREALEALKGIYADLSRTDELVRVLRRLLDLAPDDAARAAQLVDAARLLERLRGDPTEVFECWRRAFLLTTDDHQPMLDEMRRLAESSGDWRRYFDVLDLARARAEGSTAEAAVVVEQAKIAERRLEEPDRAYALARTAFELDPDGPTLALLVRLAEARGAWEEVVAARVQAAEHGADRGRRAELFQRAAETTEQHLDDPPRAFELYAQALEAGGREAEVALVRLAEAHGLWDRLVEIVGARWRGKKQVSARIDALLRLADLLERRADDWERAFEQVVMALQLDPRHPRARAMAWRMAEAHDGWAFVARVLELKAADAEEGWLKVSLLRDLATVQADHLGEPGQGFDTLRRAFPIRPWDEDTQAALWALAERTDGWTPLASFLEEEAGWADEQSTRLRLYRMAAEVHQAHGDPAEGARILQKVTELAPAEAETVEAVLELRRRAGDPADLVQALETYARDAEPDRRRAMLLEMAAVYAGPLDAPTKAEDAWRQVLEIVPDDDAVFARLTDSLRGRSAWRDLAEALERRARTLPAGEARAALQSERAELLRGRLGRLADAFAVDVELATARPEDLDRLFALVDRADAARGHQALLACAERSLEVVGEEDQPRVLTLIGRVARDHFGNLTKALECLARALELAPDAQLAREVAELLKTRRRYGELVVLYQAHGPAAVVGPDEPSDTRDARARWALMVAGLQADQLYRTDEAIETLLALVAELPEHLDGWERLRSLALRAKDGDLLADAVTGLEAAVAPAMRLTVLETGARDVARLGAVERAVTLWRRVLEIAPGRAVALDALEALAGRRKDASLRAETLIRRVANTRNGAERAVILRELGELHRDYRDDPEAAEAAFREAWEAAPTEVESLEALADLVMAREDPQAESEITTALREAWRRTRAESTRGRLGQRLADLLLREASRATAARDRPAERAALAEAWEAAPLRADVGQRYADLLFDGAALEEAAAVYAALPAPSGGEEGRPKAVEHLRRARAFQMAGEHSKAVRHFDAASHDAQTASEALGALAEIQEAAGRWEAAIRLHLKLADAAAEPARRQAAWVAAGHIAERRLNKVGRAIGLYVRAVRDGLREVPLLVRILPALRDQGLPADALLVVDGLLAAEHEPVARARLLGVRAELQHRAGAPEAARSSWREAMELAPLDVEASQALLAHLDEAPPAEQIEILSEIRARIGSGGDRGALPMLLALGRTLAAREDLEGAVEVYTAVLGIDRRNLSVREALADLHRRLASGDGPEAVGHLEAAIRHQLAVIRARPGEAGPLRTLSRLYEQVAMPGWLLDPLSALECLEEITPAEAAERAALYSSPPPVPALDVPGRMELVARDAWREAAGMLLRALWGWLGADLDALFGGAPPGAPPGAVAAEDDPHLAADAVHVRAALGLTDRRLWIVDGDRPASLWRVHPTELVVGRQRFAGEPRQRVFRIARALELSRGPAVLAHYAPEAEARALFGAAIVLALGDDGMAFARELGASPALVPAWAAFLRDRLDVGQQATLERFVGPVVATGPGAFHLWAEAVRQTANRVGLVLAGDLATAVEAIRDELPALRSLRRDAPEAFRVMLERAPDVADLHDFTFGESLLGLRQLLWRQESRPPPMARLR